MLDPDDLNPPSLLEAIESARDLTPAELSMPDTSGAATTARIINERMRPMGDGS